MTGYDEVRAQSQTEQALENRTIRAQSQTRQVQENRIDMFGCRLTVEEWRRVVNRIQNDSAQRERLYAMIIIADALSMSGIYNQVISDAPAR